MFARIFIFLATAGVALAAAKAPSTTEADTVSRIFAEALSHGHAFARLGELTSRFPGRLAGSTALDGAVAWGQQTLANLGIDRVYTQEVQVPHWVRGAPESVQLLAPSGAKPLSATALGNCPSTPEAGVTAEVVEVHSLDEVEKLGREGVAGKIVFFNRPMNPAVYRTGLAYAEAGDQRNRGPGLAAKYGAVGALTRSLTLAHDDVPHTGNTSFPPDFPRIPALALSLVACDALSAAVQADPSTRVTLITHGQKLPDALSHNVIGEIRGAEFPDQVIVVGGHLDSWDITPGAHDDGAGVVQSIEVLRLFHALGLKPRHTIRCVLFVNEENGNAGAARYAQLAREEKSRHIFAAETDNGGFAPSGFNFGSAQGDAHERAARWRPLFETWGLWNFIPGSGGADVGPLLAQGVPVAGLIPDSQRYFDYHHSRSDSLDKVNPRELHLGAAALASLVWLVDTEGL